LGYAVPGTLVAFDDTDSPDGMCTTYLAVLAAKSLGGYDLIGLPRLVRLNPNIPWKTRGNAAICLSVGRGAGPAEKCGEIDGRAVMYYRRGSPADPREVLDIVASLIESKAEFDCENTNPGVVATNGRPSPSLYWRAVRDVVPLQDVERELRGCGAVWRKFKNGRGVIGAASAISWRPRDRTWEVIAYRSEGRFGTPRSVDPESVIEMDKATKATFNNYDYENGHVAISPGSPCPILFGIRGDSAEELLAARTMIRGEEQASWMLFLTNQGTEEHLVDRSIASLSSGDSARVRVRVVSPPATIHGGHVIVRVSDGDEIDAAFYEPSGGFREIARSLLPGDGLVLSGSVRGEPRALNVEKVKVEHLVDDIRKVRNPVCKKCGKSMGSMGSGQGFRCKKCGAKAASTDAVIETVRRKIAPGWYEPPVSSRRHLHKPLRRMSRVTINKI
jgi:tRNA(Ile2)-agmatinylcytidine synthase